MHNMVPILVVVLAVSVGTFMLFAVDARARSEVADWLSRNGFQLLEIEARAFKKGPFTFTGSPNQHVFRIEARDSAGGIVKGWARYGDWVFGWMSDEVEVRWDDA
ncbi:hypothetical protein llg_10150 [Luteolibacter sp. LG18]|nr:hypothetical protein llg_10150 [Luteolibacter sp. LG18]